MNKSANKNTTGRVAPVSKKSTSKSPSSPLDLALPLPSSTSAPTKTLARDPSQEPRPAQKSKKPRLIAISAAILGLATLVAGIVILVLNLTAQPAVLDADFLVSVGQWRRDDAASVVWDFTEIGKGTLTTNSHTNDYPFLWSITDNTLNLETTWLYTLNDSYLYDLDQSTSTLTLTSGDGSYVFRPVTPLLD